MSPRFLSVAAVLTLIGGVAVAGEDPAFGVEYVSGDRPWKCRGPCIGRLVVTAEDVRLTQPFGTRAFGRTSKDPPATVFTIPFSTITAVTEKTQHEDDNQGAAVFFGLPVLSKNEEYVTIIAETTEGAGALVFKVAPHTASNVVAKIAFAVKKAKETQTKRPAVQP